MSNKRAIRFVSALASGNKARLGASGEYGANVKNKRISLDSAQVRRLVCDGVLMLQDGNCYASSSASYWIKRQLLSQDKFGEQHREIALIGEDLRCNLLEGAMSQLSIARNGSPPFMSLHHVQAATIIQNLVQTAQMRQRTTMSYDPNRIGSKKGSSASGFEFSEGAMDARKKLNNCLTSLPRDCAGVVLDVCGLQKGLQLVETERKWPRRSAKLVLRVGLDQVATHFGLSQIAKGNKSSKPRHWMHKGSRASSF